MSDTFSVPCVVSPAVKMNASMSQVKKVRSRELRGSRLFNKCLCNARNGLQMECPLAECQQICFTDRTKCPYRSFGKSGHAAGDHPRANDCNPSTVQVVSSEDMQSLQDCTENQVIYQQPMDSKAQNDMYGIQEGYLQDGQTVVQTKDGTPVNLNDGDVAYIDYGYPPMAFPGSSGSPGPFLAQNTKNSVFTSHESSEKSDGKQKSGAPSATNMMRGYPMMPQPYMMPPNQFYYPGYQQMPHMGMNTQPMSYMNMGAQPMPYMNNCGK